MNKVGMSRVFRSVEMTLIISDWSPGPSSVAIIHGRQHVVNIRLVARALRLESVTCDIVLCILDEEPVGQGIC